MIGPYASALDSLLPGATGVFVAEVTDVAEYDDRPMDGDLYQSVTLRALRSSGSTLKRLQLIRAGSGMLQAILIADGSYRVRQDTSAVRFRMSPDALSKGHTYWFATASGLDRRYPAGLVGAWPAESTTAVAVVEHAIESDAYAWHPETRGAGYVTGWRQDGDSASCRVRVWHEGRALWERRLQGRADFSGGESWRLSLGRGLGSERPPASSDTAYFLVAKTATHLDPSNPFGVRAGRWRVRHVIDVPSGREVASQLLAGPSDAELVFQAFDEHDVLVYERVTDHVPTGGKAVGAESDDWLRFYERWVDPSTGKTVREMVTRYDAHSRRIQVDTAAGLAAGPLKSAGP